MSHLDTAYKLGAARAAEAFTAWLEREADNPTGPPTKTAAEQIVQQVLEKFGARACPNAHVGEKPKPALRSATKKGSRFKALKKKLSRKKNRG